jgi:pilus assembly protein CpaE
MSTVEYGIEPVAIDDQLDDQAPESIDIDQIRPLPRISIHAFCESEDVMRLMDRCSRDRRMAKVTFKINNGSIAAAAGMFTSVATPNLIILETSVGMERLFEELGPLAEVCDPSTKVIIIGRHNDIGLYRELMRNGISEYLVYPVSLTDMLASVASIFVDPDAEPLGRSIAFIGAKGGVGSSTIAHNAAFGISSLFATETILADLDLPFGTANINFDQDPAMGMSEAVYSPDRLDEIFLDRLLAKCTDNLSLLAAPSMLDRAYDFGRDAFQPVVEVLSRSAPVTVLDVPHAWNDWTRMLLSGVDEVVVTAVPDLANLRNTKNMFDALKKMRPNDKPPHLILNQAGMPKRTEISPGDFVDPLGVQPIAVIPFEVQLFGNAANSGRMIAEIDPKSPIAETFSQVAHVVTGRTTVKRQKGGSLAKMLALLNRTKRKA